MGLFSEFFFGTERPKRITKEEFEDIRSNLYGKLERDEWAEVEKLFLGDLEEEGTQKGIDREEYERGIAWLRDNMDKHTLEESDIEHLERYCEEHLRD